jgi:hypothetical protein
MKSRVKGGFQARFLENAGVKFPCVPPIGGNGGRPKQKLIMRKIILIVSTTFLTILTIVFVMIFIDRLTLPYNSEGSYFDEKDSVVYYSQSIIGYGLLTFFILTTTIISTYFMIKKIKKKATLK